LDAKSSQIRSLQSEVDRIDGVIGASDDPKTGLTKAISQLQTSLQKNQNSQKEQTQIRKEENVDYHQDTRNIVEAENLLGRAITVLAKYYTALESQMKVSASLVQAVASADPDAAGRKSLTEQGEHGGAAVKMLKYILSESEKEHAFQDKAEAESLSEFETQMGEAKKNEGDMLKSLAKLKGDLATNEQALQEGSSDLKDTAAAKNAIEDYLLSIKSGCDFMMSNFALRETNRGIETAALDKSTRLIKATSVYKQTVASAKALAVKCKSECKLDTTDRSCKACMAGQ